MDNRPKGRVLGQRGDLKVPRVAGSVPLVCSASLGGGVFIKLRPGSEWNVGVGGTKLLPREGRRLEGNPVQRSSFKADANQALKSYNTELENLQ